MALRTLTGTAVVLFAVCCFRPHITSLEVHHALFTESDIRYSGDDVPLAAALLMPDGKGPFPGAVILQGSGESSRSNAWSRQFAEGLASRGIAVLLTDKRGSGASGGDWRHASFLTLAADARAAVEVMRKLTKTDGETVGVVGLSQGGFVAPAAAAASRHIAFVVDVSGAATTVVDQVNLEMRNTFRQAGLSQLQIDEGMRLQQAAIDVVTHDAWEEYRRQLDQALAGALAPVAKGFPSTRDSWVWDFWHLNHSFDPIVYWRQVQQPVLVVYGAEDEHDNVPVAASVERLQLLAQRHPKSWHIEVVAGSGHALYEPSAPQVRADVLDLIARTIHQAQLRR
jgi:pimeloyl-ACP methyl ester carboxylesterase